VLLVFKPVAIVDVSIGIVSHSTTVGFAILELTLVSALIWVNHHSCSLDLIFDELSVVDLARIGKVVLTLPVELSVNKITLIGASFELELSLSGFLSLGEVTSVLDLIVVPDLCSFALLKVVNPLTIIEAAFGVDKCAHSMCLSINPLSLVDVSVGVCHSSLTVEETSLGLSLVHGSIWEFDSAESLEVSLLATCTIGWLFSLVCLTSLSESVMLIYFLFWLDPVSLVCSALADVLEVVVPVQVVVLFVFQQKIELLI